MTHTNCGGKFAQMQQASYCWLQCEKCSAVVGKPKFTVNCRQFCCRPRKLWVY